jgi:hypothetical protein
MPKPLARNVEYVYFSDRLVAAVEAQADRPRGGKWGARVSAQPFGVGVTASYDQGDPRSTPQVGPRSDEVTQLLTDLTVEGFDPNGLADFVHGHTRMWWGGWFVKMKAMGADYPEYVDAAPGGFGRHQDTRVAYFGSEYTMSTGERVLACLFGSRKNLVGYFGDSEESRLYGWTASTYAGVELLLTLALPEVPGDPSIQDSEEAAFARLNRQRSDDILTSAAGIVTSQGMLDDRDIGVDSTQFRGFTIGEGHLEWLARAYMWGRDIEVLGGGFYDVVWVGAPLWVRSSSKTAITRFGPMTFI